MTARSNFDAGHALLPERPGPLKSLVRRVFGRARPDSLWDDEDPIRSELFSVERLEQHAESLAAAQPIIATADLRPVARRPACADNERVLLEAYRSIAKAADEGRRDHAGRRMAARQLSPRRRADPRDPRRPAAGLLPPAAEAGRRAARRLSARVRPRLGLRRPHRQPVRPRDAAPLRARLPDASSR